MEDVHRIVPNLDGSDELSFFAVYDGHGGREIADFIGSALEQNIAHELKLGTGDIPEQITRAFLLTDEQSRSLDIVTSGATAVCALLKSEESGRVLYVANVGDSRAVLCSRNGLEDTNSPNTLNYRAQRLSYDHRAEDEEEQKRIKASGGFITRSRVLGILAVSRSFGDHGMKDFVISEPYVTTTHLGKSEECPFLILACDGLWDVMTDQEAIEMVLELGPEKNEEAAKILVTQSISRGSADNITAIVVFL
jgi:serine/threonine protein phosphatase PrpC